MALQERWKAALSWSPGLNPNRIRLRGKERIEVKSCAVTTRQNSQGYARTFRNVFWVWLWGEPVQVQEKPGRWAVSKENQKEEKWDNWSETEAWGAHKKPEYLVIVAGLKNEMTQSIKCWKMASGLTEVPANANSFVFPFISSQIICARTVDYWCSCILYLLIEKENPSMVGWRGRCQGREGSGDSSRKARPGEVPVAYLIW